MPKTLMWIMEADRYGPTGNQFSMDDPIHIPRIGEFIDSDKAGGWVSHVQYYYNHTPFAEYDLVVNVYLKEEK